MPQEQLCRWAMLAFYAVLFEQGLSLLRPFADPDGRVPWHKGISLWNAFRSHTVAFEKGTRAPARRRASASSRAFQRESGSSGRL